MSEEKDKEPVKSFVGMFRRMKISDHLAEPERSIKNCL